jgi:hypothetical protein
VIEWFQAHWPHILSSIVATAATLGLSYRLFAERLFGHFFDRRLEGFKAARAKELETFKHQQTQQIEHLRHERNQEIEQLKGQIGHLSDRGKHSNEREYTALSELWDKAVDLYFATNTCVISWIEHPQLNTMSDEELGEFLNTTEFTDR